MTTRTHTQIETAWYHAYLHFLKISRPLIDRPISISPIGDLNSPVAYAISIEGTPAYALQIIRTHCDENSQMAVVDSYKVARVKPKMYFQNNSRSKDVLLWEATEALFAERGIPFP